MIWEDLLQLFLAMALGGLIGLEREFSNNPAGFRTHTLVCMGSALVMIISRSIVHVNEGVIGIDPLRLGAQVISGIGFLGAGTIIKDGSRVRGLTTAASLWVVACVGLAIGAGLYELSIGAALMVFTTLVILKKAESVFSGRIEEIEVLLIKGETSQQLGLVHAELEKMDVNVKNIKLVPQDDAFVQAKFFLKMPKGMSSEQLLEKIKLIEGISKLST